jgi:hypothetical protein
MPKKLPEEDGMEKVVEVEEESKIKCDVPKSGYLKFTNKIKHTGGRAAY